MRQSGFLSTKLTQTDLSNISTILGFRQIFTVLLNGTLQIIPPDPNSIANYTFNIHVTAEGDALLSTGPHYLALSCNETIVTPTEFSESALQFYIGDSNIGKYGLYHLEYLNFTVSNSHCPMLAYNISSSESELVPINSMTPLIGSSLFTIPIDTSMLTSLSLSILGSCLGGSFAQTPLLSISIVERPSDYLDMLTNQAPFFDQELPSVSFGASDNDFSIRFPSILDSTDNYCEIEITSQRLGRPRR